MDFDSVEEPEPTANPMFSEAYPIDSTNGEVLVFSVERANAGAVANVPLAPKLKIRTSCVAFVYSVVNLGSSKATKAVAVLPSSPPAVARQKKMTSLSSRLALSPWRSTARSGLGREATSSTMISAWRMKYL